MKPESVEGKRVRIRQYLMKCSGSELTEFMLTRHAAAANLRRQLRDLIEQWVEEATDARLAAEVNALRIELKHASALPFRSKEVQQPPPHRETPPVNAVLNVRDHGWRHQNATRRKNVY